MSDMHNLKPHIGKRIYIVDVKKMVVVPAIVKEKVIRETVEGIQTSYILSFGIDGSEQVSSHSFKDQIIVSTSTDAYELLRQHIEKLISALQSSKLADARSIVETAVSNGNERFGPEQQHDILRGSPRDVVDGLSITGGGIGMVTTGSPTTSRVNSKVNEEIADQQKFSRQKRQKNLDKIEEKIVVDSADQISAEM